MSWRCKDGEGSRVTVWHKEFSRPLKGWWYLGVEGEVAGKLEQSFGAVPLRLAARTSCPTLAPVTGSFHYIALHSRSLHSARRSHFLTLLPCYPLLDNIPSPTPPTLMRKYSNLKEFASFSRALFYTLLRTLRPARTTILHTLSTK